MGKRLNIKIFYLVFFLLTTLVVCGGCDKSKRDRQIASEFTDLVMDLKIRDVDQIDEIIHSQSPFLKANPAPTDRARVWMIQSVRMDFLKGNVELLGTRETGDTVYLLYRYQPARKGLEPVESQVAFKTDGDQWKLFVPEKGIDLIPMDFDHRTVSTKKVQRFDDGRELEIRMKNDAVSGYDQEYWLDYLRKQRQAEGVSGSKGKESEKKTTSSEKP